MSFRNSILWRNRNPACNRIPKSNDKKRILASAVIETSFDIKPKPCDNTYGSPATNSGFPALLASTVTMGGNDVIGQTSEIFSAQNARHPATWTNADGIIDSDERTIQNEPAISCNTQCDVGGEIFIGDIDIPAVPEFPLLRGRTDYSDVDLKTGDMTITAGALLASTITTAARQKKWTIHSQLTVK